MPAYISKDDLSRHLEERERDSSEQANCMLRSYRAAMYTLQVFLGPIWAGSNLARSARSQQFLHPKQDKWHDQFKHPERVVALGEALFNLQYVEGFHERIRRIATGDVETCLGELEGARLLYQSTRNIRFVSERGKTGNDYDIEVDIDSVLVPCEVKTKLESTKPTSSTIRETLKKAQRQLPPERPGIVLLKLPEAWARDAQAQRSAQSAIVQCFRDSKRVALVILHWERWHRVYARNGQDSAGRITVATAIPNRGARVKLDGIELLARRINSQQRTREWEHFDELLCDSKDVKRLPYPLQSLVPLTLDNSLIVSEPVQYMGSLDRLLTSSPEQVVTVVDFECDNFELAKLMGDGTSCTVTLADHETSDFSILLGETASHIQLQIPGKLYDGGLTTTPEGDVLLTRERVNSQLTKLNAGLIGPDDVSEDEFVLKLQRLFSAMRREGDLVQPQYELRELMVRYFIEGNEDPIFVVLYRDLRIKV